MHVLLVLCNTAAAATINRKPKPYCSNGTPLTHLRLLHNLRQANAHSRQDARVAVHKNGAHAQGGGNGARVLPACAAEAGQHVLCDVVALRVCG